MPLVGTALQYGYSDSWEFFLYELLRLYSYDCHSSPRLKIIIAVSMVFSSEYSMKTDVLILTTNMGKTNRLQRNYGHLLIFATLWL